MMDRRPSPTQFADLPHLSISYLDMLPGQPVEVFREEVAVSGLQLVVDQRPSGTLFASLEWFLPTALVVFISKPYFEGFLKEAGSDHYKLLKGALSRLFQRMNGVKVSTIGSEGKVEKHRTFTIAYSIYAQIDESQARLKFLIQENLTDDERDLALAHFLDFLARFHDGKLDDREVASIRACPTVGRTLLVAYDFEQGRIEGVDPTPKPKSGV